MSTKKKIQGLFNPDDRLFPSKNHFWYLVARVELSKFNEKTRGEHNEHKHS